MSTRYVTTCLTGCPFYRHDSYAGDTCEAGADLYDVPLPVHEALAWLSPQCPLRKGPIQVELLDGVD